MPKFLIYIASWLSVTGGIYGLFNKAEDVLGEESRSAIADWLKRLDLPLQTLSWSNTAARIFDTIFTDKHLSHKCFLRSSFASVLSVFVVSLVALLLTGKYPNQLIEQDTAMGYVLFLIATLVCNVIPDYFSLLETRLMINIMGNTQSWIIRLGLLAADIVATLAIFALVVLLELNVIGLLINERVSFSVLAEDIVAGLTFKVTHIAGPAFGVFVYSTFFTSVWLWLYFAGGLVLKILGGTRSGLHFLQRHLDLDNKPLQAIGFVVITLITVLYIVFAPFLLMDTSGHE